MTGTMQAWLATETGPWRDVMRRGELPRPDLKPGESLIRTSAASVVFADLLTIAGRYQIKPPLPFAPGFEAAGHVVETAEGCPWKIGDRLVAIDVCGGWAEYTVARPGAAFTVPDSMTDAQAAAFVINYHTAYFGLFHRGRLQPGETLLVHGGAGGVGTAAIQLGHAKGARVMATAGSEEKLAVCRHCGADEVIHHRDEDFVERVLELTNGEGADVIYDPVGGDTFDRSTRCIAVDGRLVVIGFAEGRIPEIKTNRLLLKNFSVGGFFFRPYRERKPSLVERYHNELNALARGGAIDPVLYRTYAFADLLDALEAIENRESYGKVVLSIHDASVNKTPT